MNVALIGSVSSSWHTLDALIKNGIEVVGVLGLDESRRDKVSDYHSLRRLTGDAGIPFQSFVKISEPACETFLRANRPDLLFVIGLSQLAPCELIDAAPHGGVGFHPTMLPKGRGRAPVAWTILLGEPAAATLFFLTEQADAGDIIIQKPVEVLPEDYSADLIERTNGVLREAIAEIAPAIASGNLPRTPQDDHQATYYEKRTPDDGLIDWHQSVDKVYRLIRAASRPYPGAFAYYRGQKVVIWRARPAADAAPGEPGTILQVSRGGVTVRAADGSLLLTEMESASNGQPLSPESFKTADRLQSNPQDV